MLTLRAKVHVAAFPARSILPLNEIPSSTRSDAPSRQPSLILVSLGLMTRIAFVLLLMVACCRAETPRLGVERSRDLGHGFHRDVIAQQNPPGFFESVGHFEYLFYRDRKLCQLSFDCAVAPSGTAIVYQDGPSGLIFLFRPAEGRPVQLTQKFFGIIDQYDWHESEGFIHVVADKDKPSKKERRLTIPRKT